MRNWVGKIVGAPVGLIAALFLVASQAHGATASYTANLSTSLGNPVYDVLILEADAGQQVHATVYPGELPGSGTSVLPHDVPFTPVRTLVIGLTEGKDDDGTEKTQIVMFLDPAFAAAHSEVPFSTVFPGARHSVTITNLQAAVQGDAAQLAWFTDTFFSGPAAGAAFASRGPFAVAEFTSLTIIGANATFGNWVINSKTTLPFSDPNAQSNRATEVIDETAQVDNGPFDITFTVNRAGQFAADKTVLNDTGVPWTAFEMRLGTDSGASFVPSTPGDGLSFVAALPNREETGAFPDVVVLEDRIVFHGFLAPGESAHFIVFVNTNATSVTLRQLAVSRTAAAPLMGPWALAFAALLLCALGASRLYRPQARHGLLLLLLFTAGTVTPISAQAAQLVFVTSDVHDGNLGGLAGGDAICADRAGEAGLPGTFVAWLSNSGINAGDRVLGDGPFVRTDSVQVAADRAVLLSGNLEAPISATESGSHLLSNVVWTGTAANGDGTGNTCQGWNTADGMIFGTAGLADQSSSSWTNEALTVCSGSRHIYCFQQPITFAPAPLLASGPMQYVALLLVAILGGLAQLRRRA